MAKNFKLSLKVSRRIKSPIRRLTFSESLKLLAIFRLRLDMDLTNRANYLRSRYLFPDLIIKYWCAHPVEIQNTCKTLFDLFYRIFNFLGSSDFAPPFHGL